jgi:hypothetical protein
MREGGRVATTVLAAALLGVACADEDPLTAAATAICPEFESWGGFRGSVKADFAVSGRLEAF